LEFIEDTDDTTPCAEFAEGAEVDAVELAVFEELPQPAKTTITPANGNHLNTIDSPFAIKTCSQSENLNFFRSIVTANSRYLWSAGTIFPS
jgi:hypothetical protein